MVEINLKSIKFYLVIHKIFDTKESKGLIKFLNNHFNTIHRLCIELEGVIK
jgi:hypothetical protein